MSEKGCLHLDNATCAFCVAAASCAAAETDPKRIQRKRSKGWRLPAGTVTVTRPGKWGNPFQVGEAIKRDSDLWPYATQLTSDGGAGLASIKLLRQEDAVAAYGWWFIEQPALMLTVEEELGGRDLACFCKPGAPCHADFLLAMANGLDEIPGETP